ncbi:MAG: ATP-binding protein [Lachnospiraceae bacterium]|jgi:hypothetical protein
MMPEIAMSILDVAENSTRAEASLVRIEIDINTASDRMKLIIADDGCGMTQEQVERVTDPFFTTRTTRKVGLGVPFLKQACEAANGEFTIDSKKGEGTEVTAVFEYSNIDRMPIGDLCGTIQQLIVYHPEIDFLFRYSYDGNEFVLDTRQMREILGGIPLDLPEVAAYILDYLEENKREVDGGMAV